MKEALLTIALTCIFIAGMVIDSSVTVALICVGIAVLCFAGIAGLEVIWTTNHITTCD